MTTSRRVHSLTAHRDFFIKHGQKVQYPKNQIFVSPSDPSQWVYFLVEGMVKVSFSLRDGSEQIMGYFWPGSVFAQSRSFYENDGGGLIFQALYPSTLYRVHQKVFFQQLKTSLEFAAEYIQQLQINQIFLVERALYQGEHSVQRRCVRWLLFMARYYGEPTKQGDRLIMPLTQETVANFLHSSRESAGKTLQALIKDGYIAITKKRITIKDSAGLKQLLHTPADA